VFAISVAAFFREVFVEIRAGRDWWHLRSRACPSRCAGRCVSRMFHVEQPFSLLTPIRCSDLHFSKGMPSEEHVPEVAGKTDGELRNAQSDARNLGSNHGIWEFWKSKISKKNTWRVVAIKESLSSSISLFLCL